MASDPETDPASQEPDDRAPAEDNDEQRARLLGLSAAVGRALTTHDTLAGMLQGCAQAMVNHLDAAFARVWVLNAPEDTLELRASAGLYTHLDGPHGRVPVGQLKIGLIARERRPHLTNAVLGDPRVSDQAWAAREGMVAFAGYPLLVGERLVGERLVGERLVGERLVGERLVGERLVGERLVGERLVGERLVGVTALFARRPLSAATLRALGAVADQIAVGIERLRAQEERQASHDRLVEVLESLGDGFYALDADFRFTYVNSKAEALWGRSRSELLGRRLQDEFPQMRDSHSLARQAQAMAERIPCHYETASPVLGRWVEVSAYPSGDGLSVYFRDISSRKEVEDTLRQFQFLVESANDAFFLLDEAGHFLYVNAAACRSLGYTAEEFGRMRPHDIDPLHDEAMYQALFRRLSGESVPPFESVHRRADGTTFPIEASVSRLDIGARPLLFSSARDISDRKAAERALQEAHQRTAGILESITDAFITLDTEWRFTYVNDQAETVISQKRTEILGRSFWDVFPETVGSAFERHYRRAADEGVVVTFEEFFPPLDSWFEVRAYPSDGGLSLFFQNINERRRAQDALRASEEALRENEARLRDTQARLEAALSAGGIATWTWDVVGDRVVADANLSRLFSVSPEDAAGGRIGVYFQAIHPEDRSRVQEIIEDALADREVYEAEYRVVLPDGSHRWLATRGRVERDATGQAVSLPGVVLDITERAERERRERFLADLSERTRGLLTPDAVIADAVSLLGEFLGLYRCAFGDIDTVTDTCKVPVDYRADEGAISQVGVFPISAFGAFVAAEIAAGRCVVVDDVHADSVRVPPETLAAYEALSIRAHITVPVVHSTRLVSILSCHSAVPRHWTPEEVELVQTVVERTWLTAEVARQERALTREAEEQRARAEREALLNRIGQTIRSASDPEAVQAAAAALLGEALGADRCYVALYDLARGVVTIIRDRHRPGLPPIQGIYPFGNTVEMFHELYHDSNTSVIADALTAPLSAETRANMQRLQLRSRISVALADGDGLMATLTAAMADEPREWTVGEVALVEAVGTQLRTAVEMARVAQREHNIAQQLQTALQPELPGTVPGLALTRHYEAALAEAGVGGDFYDVYAVEKGCTALVVGDLSGKGLAAAAQVSVVRNMLRAFLYSQPTVGEAVTGLNRVLSENGLLTGFTTLFVGTYDSATGLLKYVNCGQEPALVRRAGMAGTDQVETLPPTGPILGAIENAQFVESSIALGVGDALVVFTDGLTEVGATRAGMLGIEGMIALLEGVVIPVETGDASSVAEGLKRHLITGVEAFAQSGARDDMCLLVGVVH